MPAIRVSTNPTSPHPSRATRRASATAAALAVAVTGCASPAAQPSPMGSAITSPTVAATPLQPEELLSTSGIVHDGDTTSWGREWTGGRYSLVISCTSPRAQHGHLHWRPARSSGARSTGIVDFSCSQQGTPTRQIVQLTTYAAMLEGEFALEQDALIELSWARA